MSEAAAEAPTRTQRPGSSGAPGNIFTRKFGPLPGWGWAALAGAGAIGFWWYRSRKSSAAAAAGSVQGTTDVAAATGDDIQGQLAAIQTEIQDLQQAQSTDTDKPGGAATGGGGKKHLIRHVSNGKNSLNTIARDNKTSVAHILAISQSSPENEGNLDKLQAWAKHPGTRRKDVVYYTD